MFRDYKVQIWNQTEIFLLIFDQLCTPLFVILYCLCISLSVHCHFGLNLISFGPTAYL